MLAYSRDKRVTEIDCKLKYAIFSTACSIVYKYCTRPISGHQRAKLKRVALNETLEFPFWGLNICVDLDKSDSEKWRI